MQKLRFRDIQLGFEPAPLTKRITQEKIEKNAEGSLDYNPIHIDPAWAKKINLLGKGTTIAHGMMTLAFMGKVVTDWIYPNGGFLKSLEGKFTNPVRPGEDITARAVVTQLHPRHESGESFALLELECKNQDGNVVAVGKASARIPD